MNRRLRNLSLVCCFSAALVLCGAWPQSAHAAWLGFRNDIPGPVVVQGANVVNNVIRRGKPLPLNPTEIAWDQVPQPGNRLITVYDTRTGRVLFQGVIPVAAADLFFSIQLDLNPIPPAPDKGPRVKLVPTKPPSPPPRLP